MGSIPKISDVAQRFQDTLITYFKDKTNITLITNAISSEIQKVFNTIDDLKTQRSLDVATGKNLDNIGEIVGELRSIISTDEVGLFGFYGDAICSGFGALDDPNLGGTWQTLFYNNSEIPISRLDYQYKQAIEVRIQKNIGAGSPEEIIFATKQLTEATLVRLVENTNNPCEVSLFLTGTFQVGVLEHAASLIRSILPIGVALIDFQQEVS